MFRRVLALALLAVPAAAQGRYEQLIQEAHEVANDHQSAERLTARLIKVYGILGQATEVDPRRFESWFWRGIYKCAEAREIRTAAKALIEEHRLRNVSTAEMTTQEILDHHKKISENFIAQSRDHARRDFFQMLRIIQDEYPRDEFQALLLLSNALLKYADSEFLEAGDGKRGCIADFKVLLRKNIEPHLVRYCLTWSYVEMATDAYDAEDYDKAQELWEEAFKYAPTLTLKHQILGNIAGTYEVDSRYEDAEAVLYKQIELAPNNPEAWKNLGLVLGLRSRFREALVAYAKVRELSQVHRGSHILALRHGNAWLRAAMIHGNLLPEDGDIKLAWRLFWEYRSLHGDDYNFSLAFADFAYDKGRYELAQRYYDHTKKLQPFCIHSYQRLVEIAVRLPGGADTRAKRIKEAKEAHKNANDRYVTRHIDENMKRICAGMQEDRVTETDAGPRFLDPDPLKDFGIENLPDWVTAVAAKRLPHANGMDLEGSRIGALLGMAKPVEAPLDAVEKAGWGLWVGIGAGLAGAFLVASLWARRRAAA